MPSTNEKPQSLSPTERSLVSAFVVTFNEEQDISDCLKSLDFCDEVVVIDSFSTDRTVEICEAAGAKVIQREWPGYVAQKAFGLDVAKHAWVLNLDADERVSPELRQSILKVLREDYQNQEEGRESVYSGYEINRVVFFLDRWWRAGGWYPEYRVRLMRREATRWGGSDPHEKPIVTGKIGRLAGELQHYTYKSIAQQIQQLHRFSSIAAEQDFAKGKRAKLHHLLLNPFLRMLKFYLIKQGFREGVAGVIVAINEGFYTFMKYSKLWELEHHPQNQTGLK